MIFPPTLRAAILAALESVNELEDTRLLHTVRVNRRASLPRGLKWLGAVSEPRFEIMLARLRYAGLIAYRRDGDGARVYCLIRQWPGAVEKMGQTASRMLSGPIIALLFLILAGCAIEATCHEGRCSVIHRDAVRAGSVGVEK